MTEIKTSRFFDAVAMIRDKAEAAQKHGARKVKLEDVSGQVSAAVLTNAKFHETFMSYFNSDAVQKGVDASMSIELNPNVLRSGDTDLDLAYRAASEVLAKLGNVIPTETISLDDAKAVLNLAMKTMEGDAVGLQRVRDGKP
jgi:hypothetical protein